MKRLKDIVMESFFDDEINDPEQLEKSIKEEIKQFLKDNYRGASGCKISGKPNEDGKYVVDCKGTLTIMNTKATSLTNGAFVFGEVADTFYCAFRDFLTSLEGAPQKVGGDFNCSHCNSLTSLEGAPKEVRGKFSCSSCKKLATLKGAPESVGGNFECHFCRKLTSLEGAPKEVRGEFDCSWCDSLISLEGAPKWVGGDFNCGGNEQKFDEKEVRKHIPHMGGKSYV